MKSSLLTVLTSKVVIFLICAPLLSTGGTLRGDTPYWPMVGYNEAHTNWNSQESSLYPPFPVEIVDSVGGVGVGGLSSSDGILYVGRGGEPNQVSALDIATNDILWTFSIPNSRGSIDNTPAVWDTLVYVGGQQGTHLYCLDARTGIEVWSHPTGSLYSRPATVDEGRVYVATGDSLVCLDGVTGSLLWGRGSSTRPTPAIQGSTLYTSLQSDSIAAHDKITGDLIWGVDSPVAYWGSVVAGDSLLYFVSNRTDVKALRLVNGSEKWSRTFPGEEISELATGAMALANNLLYVSIWSDSAGNGKVYALGGDDGAPIWESSLDAEGAFSPVVANSVVYVSDWWGGTLYALDALTGNRITTFSWLSQQYIVSDGSLIALRFGTPELHILRMEPLGIGDGRETGSPLPRVVSLAQNHPNPFNPATELMYRLADERSQVKLSIYDVRGRLVRTLVDRIETAGEHAVRWDGTNARGESLSSGVYLYRLEVKGPSPSEVTTHTRKMLLAK